MASILTGAKRYIAEGRKFKKEVKKVYKQAFREATLKEAKARAKRMAKARFTQPQRLPLEQFVFGLAPITKVKFKRRKKKKKKRRKK